MSEFDHPDSNLGEFDPTEPSSTYALIGPPKALIFVGASISFFAVIATILGGDSVLAFGLAVMSCLITLSSRAQNQSRMNEPSYSSTRWFGIATTILYCLGSFFALAQVLMVAYVAGR